MSGCGGVCVLVDVDEPPELHSSKTRVARKKHECGECGGSIEPGEQYEHFAGLNDGRWWSAKTCAPCVEIRSVLMCEGWLFGTLWDDIEEQAFPEFAHVGVFECLAQLESKASRDLLAARFTASTWSA